MNKMSSFDEHNNHLVQRLDFDSVQASSAPDSLSSSLHLNRIRRSNRCPKRSTMKTFVPSGARLNDETQPNSERPMQPHLSNGRSKSAVQFSGVLFLSMTLHRAFVHASPICRYFVIRKALIHQGRRSFVAAWVVSLCAFCGGLFC